MCSLCQSDLTTKAAAVASHHSFADDLEALAQRYRDMAEGRLESHGGHSDITAAQAHGVVRRLVEEWV